MIRKLCNLTNQIEERSSSKSIILRWGNSLFCLLLQWKKRRLFLLYVFDWMKWTWSQYVCNVSFNLITKFSEHMTALALLTQFHFLFPSFHSIQSNVDTLCILIWIRKYSWPLCANRMINARHSEILIWNELIRMCRRDESEYVPIWRKVQKRINLVAAVRTGKKGEEARSHETNAFKRTHTQFIPTNALRFVGFQVCGIFRSLGASTLIRLFDRIISILCTFAHINSVTKGNNSLTNHLLFRSIPSWIHDS